MKRLCAVCVKNMDTEEVFQCAIKLLKLKKDYIDIASFLIILHRDKVD